MIAIYTRVSTEEQANNGVSLDAQKDALYEYAKKNNLEIYNHYEDSGITGTSTVKRKAYNQMVNDMKSGYFNKIVFYKLDRISRSVADLNRLIELCNKYNCELVSLTEYTDGSTPQGIMFMQMVGVFAQFEASTIKSRVKNAMQYKFLNGEAISSPPYGYCIKEDSHGTKRFYIDEEKKQVVLDIFNTFKENNSIHKTTTIINDKYPELVYSKGFNHTDLSKILKDTRYYGEHTLNGVTNTNYCEPYITKEEFTEINNLVKTKNVRHSKQEYLFTGIIYGTCGHRYVSRCTYSKKNGKEYASKHYGCNESIHKGTCKYNAINERRIEKELLKQIPIELENKINKEIENTNNATQDVKDNTKKIKQLEKKKENIIYLFKNGLIDKTELNNDIATINKELTILLQEEKTSSIDNLKQILEVIKGSNFIKEYNIMSVEQKRTFYRKFIDKIIVDKVKYNQKKGFIEILFL